MKYQELLKKHFSAEDFLAAEEALNQYQGYEPDRVKEAIVRLAYGSLDGLNQFVDAANKDYRDVLYWADYPDEAEENARKTLMGMTVNERLFHTDQFVDFEGAVAIGDIEKVTVILRKCLLEQSDIDAIIEQYIGT